MSPLSVVGKRLDSSKLSKKQIVACKKDFCKFLRVIWHHLGLPDPTPIQYAIARWLQHGPKRQIICGFRGVGKSWITSAFVIWLLWRDPDAKILVISASKQRADDFSTFTLKLIKEVPFLVHLSPRRDQRESKIKFDVGPAKNAHAPSVKSAGISGQITGSRATHIIADDVEVTNNSATQDMRDKLINAVAEFEAILVPEGEPRITYLGTPQTEESIYNKLADRGSKSENGYQMRVWPARFPAVVDLNTKYMGRIAPELVKALERNPMLTGAPTDPQRFNDIDLAERSAAYGKSGFALQFQLDTSLSDAEKYPLKTADLLVMDLNAETAPIAVQYGAGKDQQIPTLPVVGFSGDRWFSPMYVDKEKWKPYEGVVMAIDPSGRGKDETTYAVVAQHHGKLYVLDVGGLKGGYTTMVLLKLAKKAQEFSVKRILIEANFGDGMFTALLSPVLRRVYPCTCEEVRHNQQKELRIIDTLEPVMNQHRLVVGRSVVEKDVKQVMEDPHYSLFYQMTRITKERGALKHDDRIDVLAMAVQYWVKSMGRDEKQARADYRQKMMDNEIKEFMKGVFTKGVTPTTRPRGMSKPSLLGHRKRLI